MSTVISDEQAKAAVAENVSRLLEEQNRSAYSLMKQLDMSPGALYPIIRGETLPSLAMSARIAEALGVSVDDLLQENLSPSRK